MRRHVAPLLALWSLACTKPEPEPAPPAAEASPRVIKVDAALIESGRIAVTRAELRPVGGVVAATGQVEAPPDGAAAVTAPIAARVREIAVRRGDTVDKGQKLAVLDAADVARVRGDLARARSRRIHAERVLAQEEKLWLDKATSERALSDARSELAAARADEQAAATLLSSLGASGGAQVVLKAPIAGTVVAVDGVVGGPVEPTAPLVRLVDTKRLQVRADVAENDADRVPEGAAATLFVGGRAVACKATVESHAPHVDPGTRTVPFRIRLGEGCGELHAGAFVDVSIEIAATGQQRLVVLPRDAVVSVDEVPVVFIARGRTDFEPRSVRVAEYAGPRVFVEDGVKEGENVVERGALLLKGELMRSRLE